MARTHSTFSVSLLSAIAAWDGPCPVGELFGRLGAGRPHKAVYDAVFRLAQQGLLAYANPAKTRVCITEDGRGLLTTRQPERDGVWKLVIFDIPESKRAVRGFLRGRLKTLGFKKWQASIWVSPYRLDEKLEQELLELAEMLFIRLIKTTDINYVKDLEVLFSAQT